MIAVLAIALGAGLLLAISSILPGASFWVLPSGITAAVSKMGTFISYFWAFMPDGSGSTTAAALSAVITVDLFVIPWLAARNIRLPIPKLKIFG